MKPFEDTNSSHFLSENSFLKWKSFDEITMWSSCISYTSALLHVLACHFFVSFVCTCVIETEGRIMKYSYTRSEKKISLPFSLSRSLSVDDQILGAEMDLQLVENSVIAVENILKAWLHDQTGETEHLQLLLPASEQTNTSTNKPTPACRPDPGDSLYTYTLTDWWLYHTISKIS